MQGYVENLLEVFREVRRVLKPTGTFYLNLGDSSSGSWQNYGSRDGEQREKDTEAWERGDAVDDLPPTAQTDVPEKSVCMVPERVALALIDDGWRLRNKIIWDKPNPMPESIQDRYSTTWEYVFMFSKQKQYYFDLDAVRELYETDHDKEPMIGGTKHQGNKNRSYSGTG